MRPTLLYNNSIPMQLLPTIKDLFKFFAHAMHFENAKIPP